MTEVVTRPGFNLDATFKAHLSAIKSVVYTKRNNFISYDDRTLKAWKRHANNSTTVSYDLQFPNYQSSFITCAMYAKDTDLLFTACLDDALRIYNEKLVLRSNMPWSNGVIRQMVYNERRSEIITAGSYGVKVWECELDHEAYRSDKNVDPYAIPR